MKPYCVSPFGSNIIGLSCHKVAVTKWLLQCGCHKDLEGLLRQQPNKSNSPTKITPTTPETEQYTRYNSEVIYNSTYKYTIAGLKR
jgi:hypothetical protein